MAKFRISVALLSLIVVFNVLALSQPETTDRQPAVAGQFYPAGADELRAMVSNLFATAVPSRGMKNVRAVIVPHAGYVFSGTVAASAFNQINPAREYKNIFLIGPSHHIGFVGASIYTQGDFLTPLGRVKVNTELGKDLIKHYDVFSSRTDAHRLEHSIEVELPFLQFRLARPFKIVPIVVGTGLTETGEDALATYRRIGDALRSYFTADNLFIVSTDFSHYPSYQDALTTDKLTCNAVLSNSMARLAAVYDQNARQQIPNLVTSMCGLAGVLTFLSITESDPTLSFTLIQYKNAGDSEFGDKTRVVGYCGIAISQKEAKPANRFDLSDEDRRSLLKIARNTIATYLEKGSTAEIDPSMISGAMKTPSGAFVTLNEGGQLRGCIGRFDANDPLYAVVQKMAIAAATQDTRFLPVELKEVPNLHIEISALTPLKKIRSIDEIILGRDGIYIRKGMQSGTFLPQVAKETGWSKEDFLGHCAQDKAGIGWDGWKDAEIYTYEALVFGED